MDELARETEKQENISYRKEIILKGLDCADCAAKLEKKILALPGINSATINFGASKLLVEYTGTLEKVISVIKQGGYELYGEENPTTTQALSINNVNFRTLLTIVSGVLLLLALVMDFGGADKLVVLGFYAASILSGGFYVMRAGFRSLITLTLDMNFLMTAAVFGAVAIGEYSEGATVVFLYSLGNTLQAYTMDKTRNSIRELVKLAPKEATVLVGGEYVNKPVEKILPGEVVLVRPGERVPVDGKVLEGSSAVNQAPVTGEAMPVLKEADDPVYAGTINQLGALTIEVTKKAGDSTLAKIIHLVEEAQAQKAPSQQFVDVFAKYYTPVVVIAAISIAFVPYVLGLPFHDWFKKALILLVIACPCALVISTPVTIVAGIGSAAKRGVLIKGGAFLERAGLIKAVAFDKTGTLTTGRPQVTDVIDLIGAGESQVLSIAAAIEQFSEHPLAAAVTGLAEKEGVPWKKANNFQAFPGKGAQAIVDDRLYIIGNVRLFKDFGLKLDPVMDKVSSLQAQGKTVLLVGIEDRIEGLIAVADTIRPEAKATVKALRQGGVNSIIMLTGDNEPTANSVAAQLDIDSVSAELLPDDKLSTIQELKASWGTVAMVGDGINDAPAMAAASVAVGMGGAGTDSALETSDIVLMADDLSKLPYAVKLSRKALNIIKQNIAFSLIIKAAFIVLTFMGLSNLWMAVFADTGAALIVIANGMRLMKM